MSVCIVVGNPKARSRTLGIAEALVGSLIGATESNRASVVDLGEIESSAYGEEADRLLASLPEMQLLVVASPVYKASFTGMLKSFLDYFGQGALNGVPTIPLMTGANEAHSLVPRFTLAPLLEELGATCLPSSYFNMQHIEDVVDRCAGEAQTYQDRLRRLGALSERAVQ